MEAVLLLLTKRGKKPQESFDERKKVCHASAYLIDTVTQLHVMIVYAETDKRLNTLTECKTKPSRIRNPLYSDLLTPGESREALCQTDYMYLLNSWIINSFMECVISLTINIF